ncbi:transcription initiation factor IIF subunit alpha [Phlyctema vagabunda]|uniref:Transcription initiation factor IIF subunit alpha n=1 Tax=Phlyctema vagabunda TaxID=108571 RepID=A0ABR4PA95_9HELO
MSASPSGMSNGRTPTPNAGPGGPPQFVRKAKAADPLRARKKPVRRPMNPANPSTNGLAPAQKPYQGAAQGLYPLPQPASNLPKSNGDWTHAPQGDYQDFPLITTKRALKEGLRCHIARFAAKREIDPTDQEDFTRPLALHRRDPRQPPRAEAAKEDDPTAGVELDSKEREKLEILKAEKDARRAADLAQIAPSGNNAAALAAKKTQAFRNEKTSQVHRVDRTAKQKKESDLRYEEALPWHLEDADSKNTWVGNYEAALSDTNVVLIMDGNNFRMVPIEKWYKFTPKNQFKTLTIEEAEAQMSKKTKESRWVMKTQEKQKKEEEDQNNRRQAYGLYTVKSESSTFKNAKKETQDADDLDFEADDLFQDDDEQVTVEPDKDEDVKDAKDRIKREQLGANLFGDADEGEVDLELNEEKREAEKRKKLGKGVKKALKKREQNLIYDSESEHPYSSSSDDDTSDEEKQKEIDRKKDEEAKNKIKLESKVASGTSSKGTNTPLGRPPKQADPMKKSKSLKRPGSPNLSETEASGNESSRKKHKKHGTSTPIPGSRPMSPAPGSQSGQTPRKSSTVKLNVNSKLSESKSSASGAMSDGEATGGEMSDGAGGKNRKIKLKIGGASPMGSRVGSPAPGRAGSAGAGGSRAGSPAIAGTSMKRSSLPFCRHSLPKFHESSVLWNFEGCWDVLDPLYPKRLRVCEGITNVDLRRFFLDLLRHAHILKAWRRFGRPSPPESFVFYMRHAKSLRLISGMLFQRYQWRYDVQYAVLWIAVDDSPSSGRPGTGPLQPHEIIAALPATGISITDLMKLFAGRVGEKEGEQTSRKVFISMVKDNSAYGADKLLRPK